MSRAQAVNPFLTVPDVALRLAEDFGVEIVPASDALMPLASLPGQIDPPMRLARCALHLAKGDLKSLKDAVMMGRWDYRDLIMAAEYHGAVRTFDFNQPFDHARLKPPQIRTG